jgi:HEAT repeat protein
MVKLALILALLANGLAVFALLSRGGGGDRPGAAAAPAGEVKRDLPLDQLQRQLQEELDKTLNARDERLLKDVKKYVWNLEKLLAEWTAKLPELQTRSERTASNNSGKLEELDAQMTTQVASVDKLEKQLGSVEALAGRVKALELRPVASAAPATPAPSRPIEEPKVEMPNAPAKDPEVVKKEIAKALADLDSGDPNVIYPAITVLKDYRTVEAVPRLGALLWPEDKQNPDVFTRQAAAAALGAIKSVEGVPVLIQAIADRADMVSQQANKSFRQITEHDTELSPKARVQEKKKIVSAAFEWWSRHEDEVRARLGQPKAGAPPK